MRAASTQSGILAQTSRRSVGPKKLTNKLPKQFFDGPRKLRANVVKNGRWFVVEFGDGRATQGKTRKEALAMAADLRAVLDDRHPDNYTASWDGDSCIVVSVAPKVDWVV